MELVGRVGGMIPPSQSLEVTHPMTPQLNLSTMHLRRHLPTPMYARTSACICVYFLLIILLRITAVRCTIYVPSVRTCRGKQAW